MRATSIVLVLVAMAMPAQAQPKRFLAFGDSVTFGEGDTGVECFGTAPRGYPTRLQLSLASRGVDSRFETHAVCGERTDAGVTRIDSVLNRQGDYVIIMEGTNDVSEAVGFETTLFNLNAMARKAVRAGKEPVLASLIPRGPESGRDFHNGKTLTIGMRLSEDAALEGWEFADPFNALFGLPNFFDLYYSDQFHPNSIGYNIVSSAFIDAAVEVATRDDLCAQVPSGPCVESSSVLCLNGGRFRINSVWENFEGGTGIGTAIPSTDDTGAFFWFDPLNIELVIKVLDGTAANDHFWVFFGALSNVKFSVLVTDTETGECKEYFNPLGTFASVGDTSAFRQGEVEPPP